jgi:hypothetical protein
MSDLDTLNASCGYNVQAKKAFHRVAAKYLKRLHMELGDMYGEGVLRHNQGGIAVSGEITLHLDHLYVQVSEPFAQFGAKKIVMFRECSSRTDYCGGQNHFATAEALIDTAQFARVIQSKCTVRQYRHG